MKINLKDIEVISFGGIVGALLILLYGMSFGDTKDIIIALGLLIFWGILFKVPQWKSRYDIHRHNRSLRK